MGTLFAIGDLHVSHSQNQEARPREWVGRAWARAGLREAAR
ncbi:MAG TPA: hypothetical protein VGO13_09410 [Solirubrobacterales bacterium]|jgi:hypothetical protein|nr:hypothetical protein [Solirubrobacterales bacterium]